MEKFPYIRRAFRFVTAQIIKRGQDAAASALLDLPPKSTRLTKSALTRILDGAGATGVIDENPGRSLRRLTRAVTVAEILDRRDLNNAQLADDLRYRRNAKAAEISAYNPTAVSAIYKRFAGDTDYVISRLDEAKTEPRVLKALNIYMSVSKNTKGAHSDIASAMAMDLLDDAARENRITARVALEHLVYSGDPSVSFRAGHKLERLGKYRDDAPWPFGEGPFGEVKAAQKSVWDEVPERDMAPYVWSDGAPKYTKH